MLWRAKHVCVVEEVTANGHGLWEWVRSMGSKQQYGGTLCVRSTGAFWRRKSPTRSAAWNTASPPRTVARGHHVLRIAKPMVGHGCSQRGLQECPPSDVQVLHLPIRQLHRHRRGSVTCERSTVAVPDLHTIPRKKTRVCRRIWAEQAIVAPPPHQRDGFAS